jgi:hypothetical protein
MPQKASNRTRRQRQTKRTRRAASERCPGRQKADMVAPWLRTTATLMQANRDRGASEPRPRGKRTATAGRTSPPRRFRSILRGAFAQPAAAPSLNPPRRLRSTEPGAMIEIKPAPARSRGAREPRRRGKCRHERSSRVGADRRPPRGRARRELEWDGLSRLRSEPAAAQPRRCCARVTRTGTGNAAGDGRHDQDRGGSRKRDALGRACRGDRQQRTHQKSTQPVHHPEL